MKKHWTFKISSYFWSNSESEFFYV